MAVFEVAPESDPLEHDLEFVIRRSEILSASTHPQVTPATKSPPLELPTDKRPTPMSPPVELFLTTIVSSPALRQRQGNAAHDAFTPTADDVYDLILHQLVTTSPASAPLPLWF